MVNWISAEDDWAPEACLTDPEYSWMVYYDQENVCFTREGEAAMWDYVYQYAGADENTGDTYWTEPVAYAQETSEEPTSVGSEQPAEIPKEQENVKIKEQDN